MMTSHALGRQKDLSEIEILHFTQLDYFAPPPSTPPPPLPSHTMHIPFIHYQQEYVFSINNISKKSGLKMRIYNRADLESFL